MKKIIPYIVLFNIMGAIYYFLEILFRGYSHWTMWLLGAICGVLVGLINENYLTWEMPIWRQILIGELIVLPLEFMTGIIVNIWLEWNIWDYSQLWGNLLGQSSPLFALVFAPVILLAIFIDDYFRYFFMGGNKPKYKIR